MYEILQWIHILFFAALLSVPRWRILSLILILSAGVYLGVQPIIDIWNQTPNINAYILRASIDAMAAQAMFFWGGKHGRIQAFLLCVFAMTHVSGALEFYTQYAFIYNTYSTFTLTLNVAQLLVCYNGIISLIGNIKEGMAGNSGGGVHGCQRAVRVNSRYHKES